MAGPSSENSDASRTEGSAADAAAAQEASATRRRRRISLATLVGIVTLATGILTLRDQLFGSDDPDGPVPAQSAPAPVEEEIPSFRGTVGHLEESQEFLDFLEQNNGRAVQINASFPLVTSFETDPPEEGVSPWVNLYHEPCADRPPEGEEPEVGDCFAAHIFITGEDPDENSSLYYSGGLRLNGYFGVRSQSQEMHQGEVPLELEALSFTEASAAA